MDFCSCPVIVDVIPTTDRNAVLNLNAIAVLVIWLIGVALLVIVHVAFAFAIAYDAGNLPQGRKPYFAGKTVWFLGILLGGPILAGICLLYTSPSPRDQRGSRMPSSA